MSFSRNPFDIFSYREGSGSQSQDISTQQEARKTRRIIESDDEMDCNPHSGNFPSGGVVNEWFNSRDVSNMSSVERNSNIEEARRYRRESKQGTHLDYQPMQQSNLNHHYLSQQQQPIYHHSFDQHQFQQQLQQHMRQQRLQQEQILQQQLHQQHLQQQQQYQRQQMQRQQMQQQLMQQQFLQQQMQYQNSSQAYRSPERRLSSSYECVLENTPEEDSVRNSRKRLRPTSAPSSSLGYDLFMSSLNSVPFPLVVPSSNMASSVSSNRSSSAIQPSSSSMKLHYATNSPQPFSNINYSHSSGSAPYGLSSSFSCAKTPLESFYSTRPPITSSAPKKEFRKKLKKIRTSGSKNKGDDDDEEASFDEGDLSASDAQSGYESIDDDVDIVEQALAVVSQCESISLNLRKTLKSWETQSEVDEKDVAIDFDCIKLSRMNTNSRAQVLSLSDIEGCCPNLELKAYQLVGVNWLKLLYQHDINGVLADDMGLGKTVQTIAFLGWLKQYKNNHPTANIGSSVVAESSSSSHQPHLIVVPASTLSNWEKELEKFCPSLKVFVYHGSQRDRLLLQQDIRHSLNSENPIDVILSTYTLFERSSGKSDRGFLGSIKFDFLILDEAHCIKNSKSSRFGNLSSLRSQHRLLLSGTPVQNDISELLALLSFLMPSVFHRPQCEILIEALGKHPSSTTNPSLQTRSGMKKSKSNEKMNSTSPEIPSESVISIPHLRGMLAPFVLRRVKRDVLDQLVEKTTCIQTFPMTKYQSVVYHQILMHHAQKKEDQSLQSKELKQQEKVLKGKKMKGKSAAMSSSSKLEDSDDVDGLENENVVEDDDNEVFSLDIKVISDSNGETKSDLIEVDPSSDLSNFQLSSLSTSEAKHLFTALRKAANHPLLLRIRYHENHILDLIAKTAYNYHHFGKECDYSRVRSEINSLSDFDLHQICLQYPKELSQHNLPSEALYDSPKMVHLKEVLPLYVSQGHRMLIFSQWTRLLDLLEVLMEDLQFSYFRLDGSTPVRERQEMIDAFNADQSIPVFLLSTKAGGLGINLTAADTVILHDLDFNPENDKQAEDRCHRIGQNRPVFVHKLVTKDSVDEDILEMGERKKKLSEALLSYNTNAKSKNANKANATTIGNSNSNSNSSDVSSNPTDVGDDFGTIGWILQRALQRSAQAKIKN